MKEQVKQQYYIICADQAGSNRFVETSWHNSTRKLVQLCEEHPERYKLEAQWLERTGYTIRELDNERMGSEF
jgi:hypothetical protein